MPLLLCLQGAEPKTADAKSVRPCEAHNLKAQSIGFLVPSDDATVWRGPMASGALNQ